MSTIPDKLRAAAEDPVAGGLYSAVIAVIERAEQWQAAGMPMSALGDELLLTIGEPLGVRLDIGPFAQLVDLDEKPASAEGSAA